MKLAILRSVLRAGFCFDDDTEYLQRFDCLYADRVIGNLNGRAGFCTACGKECINCRGSYDQSCGDGIVGVVDFPAVLPYVLESPADYVSENIPLHDVLLIIHIHEQILLEILRVCEKWGTRGIVVPIEEPGWVSGSVRRQAEAICEEKKVEISFPKPFCVFKPPAGSVLADFSKEFRIGYPSVGLDVEGSIIKKANVEVSAACGATYYISRWLEGRSLDDNIEIEVISKRMHSYPCTASMERDPELDGDTPMHIAAHAHSAIIAGLQPEGSQTDGFIMSPFGKRVPRPKSARENMASMEKAKAMIISLLKRSGPMSRMKLQEAVGENGAIMSAALLMLKQDGMISVDRGTVHLLPADC